MYQQPSCAKLGPRTGVTVVVSLSDFDLVKGGGAAGRRGLRLRGPGVARWTSVLDGLGLK